MSGSVDNSKELSELRAKYPNMFIMSADVPLKDLTEYLRAKEWIKKDETVTKLSGAGEVFNMNCTMRVAVDSGRSLIVKQSRPFVERYPSVAAPFDRCDQEAQFYRLVSSHSNGASVTARTPALIGTDEESHIMALQDLGEASDWGQIYDCETKLPPKDAEDLGIWLAELHNLKFESNSIEGLQNMAMRNLTWLYVFELPLEKECGIDLETVTPGLTDAANNLRGNQEYKETVRRIGRDIMFREGLKSMTEHLPGDSVLLHGDFFPASWMKTGEGVKIIDTEFCHFGAAEWDLGVPLAHLIITNNDLAASKILDAYKKIRPAFDENLTRQITGIEIMRRLIGLAQLPLKPGSVSLQRKIELLSKSQALVLHPETSM